ncbi:MAG TPA: pilus assembly protein TadG-related protein [Dehalococcoidia bacterium]|nr:pilus assembly protein TadG-related protein [Dehalococcoidia bacterium]
MHSDNTRESGQTLILFGLLISTLLMIVALVTDVGMMAVERRRIQNAADSAALAGAHSLPGDPEGAITGAEYYAYANGVDADELTLVDVTTTNETDDTVRVEITRSVGFGFAQVFGLKEGSVTVQAAALAGTVVGGSGIAPFAIEESVFAGLAQGDTTTLKYNASSPSTGNFLPLALDGTGSKEYEENIINGSEQWLCAEGYETMNCPSIASTEPGNMVGATKDSMQWIFANTSFACDTYEEVFIVDPEDDRHEISAQCNRFSNPNTASYRLLLVPIIDSLCNGSCDVTVVGFALFFVESFTCGGGLGNSCDLVGKYAKAEGNISSLVGSFDPDSSIKSVLLIE